MKTLFLKTILIFVGVLSVVFLFSQVGYSKQKKRLKQSSVIIAGHNAAKSLGEIPMPYFKKIRKKYKILYGHTSHGSQITTGLKMVAARDNDLFAPPYIKEVGPDLGHLGNTDWVTQTKRVLSTHPDYNVVMWSWCGGCSDNTHEGINTYLKSMEKLEREFPNIIFIYMTGHLDGSGPAGTRKNGLPNLRKNNAQIRAFCKRKKKVLFDFEDIESYDPNGKYYPNETDQCGWCETWCVQNACPKCTICAHSHCFNCFQKGKAFWWMMARIAGWNEKQ